MARFAFAAIDFETTGSVSGYPVEPWQLGVVGVSEEGDVTLWESLLRIGERPFHPRASGRHAGIREKLAGAPTLEECLGEIRARCVGAPLVAHNASTEQGVLRLALPLEPFGPWIDTLKLARAAWPGLSSHKLGDLVETFGLADELESQLPGREPHDALYDALASALFLRHVLRQPGWDRADLPTLRHPDQSAWLKCRRKRVE